MEVIKVRAKVCHMSEEQMEAQETYDLGNIAKSKEWVWRGVGLEVPNICRIEEYDRTKSIIITYEDEKIMIQEPFDSLFERWAALKKMEPWKDEAVENEETEEDDLILGEEDEEDEE